MIGFAALVRLPSADSLRYVFDCSHISCPGPIFSRRVGSRAFGLQLLSASMPVSPDEGVSRILACWHGGAGVAKLSTSVIFFVSDPTIPLELPSGSPKGDVTSLSDSGEGCPLKPRPLKATKDDRPFGLVMILGGDGSRGTLVCFFLG